MSSGEASSIEFDESLVEPVQSTVDTSAIEQAPLESIATAPAAPAGIVSESPPQPAPSSTGASEGADHVGDPIDDGNTRYFSLILRDGLDLAIPDLDLFITLPDGQMCKATTGHQGAVTVPLPAEAKGQAKVEVKDLTGARQEVCRLDVEKCKEAVIVRSPKVKAKLPLRPHQQTPPPAPQKPRPSTPNAPAPASAKPAPVPAPRSHTWWSDALDSAWDWVSGFAHVTDKPPASPSVTVQKTLSAAGQPVTVVVGPECPNKDNLRLGRNNVYRQAILDASKRLGLIPQALCALLDCEAGKVAEKIPKVDAKGVALKDKKGRPLTTTLRELWNANAGNPQSGAAGLTQFLASTWLTHVLRPRFYIHDQSVVKGWVRQESHPKTGTHWAFVLSDGTVTTSPYGKRGSDANVKACLAMRMDPTWSINAAADYGAANLKVLEKAGFTLAGLSDMDKAKLMYLMHHEGEGAGPAFIRNSLGKLKGGTEGLKKKFATQLGSDGNEKAAELIARAGDDVEIAYRLWFATFVDSKFDSADRYFCSSPQTARALTKLLNVVGGVEIEKP